MGAHFEALDEGVFLVPLDHRYTQVGFNLVSIQVCGYPLKNWIHSNCCFNKAIGIFFYTEHKKLHEKLRAGHFYRKFLKKSICNVMIGYCLASQ